jgi:hypothetical protein
MNEKELIEDHAVVNCRHYGDSSSVVFNIKCTRSEIENIIQTMNCYANKHNGKLTGSIGTSEYFSWRRTQIFDNAEDFYKFIERRKTQEMENLAYRRAYTF